MSLHRNKWLRKKKPIVYKFEEQAEKNRKLAEEYWELLSLPKKKKRAKKSPVTGLAKAYAEVDERDERRCQFPSCYSTNTNHHHCLLKSRGGRNDVENLVTLCLHHHTLGKESPHQSIAWRRYWEGWAEEKYPSYWAKIREGQKITQQYNKATIGA